MRNNSLVQRIENYLSHITITNSLDRLNMCATVYSMLKENEDASTGFTFFMENVDTIESDHTQEVLSKYSEDDLNRLENQLGEMTDAIFEKLIKAGFTEKQFYQELWKALTQSYVFDNDESIIFAIYYIVIDARIPYFYIPSGTEMSDAKFKDITKKIRKDIDKARYILNTNQFNQWTTQASALLDLLDTKKNEDRTVLMAHILKILDASKRASQAGSSELSEKVLQLLRRKSSRG